MSHLAVTKTNTKVVPTAMGKKTLRGTGRRTVIYRDAKGRSFSATVMAPGTTGSTLKIRLPNFPTSTGIIDNVAPQTTLKGTTKYFNYTTG